MDKDKEVAIMDTEVSAAEAVGSPLDIQPTPPIITPNNYVTNVSLSALVIHRGYMLTGTF